MQYPNPHHLLSLYMYFTVQNDWKKRGENVIANGIFYFFRVRELLRKNKSRFLLFVPRTTYVLFFNRCGLKEQNKKYFKKCTPEHCTVLAQLLLRRRSQTAISALSHLKFS